MFNTRIVVELSDNTKVILPDTFRIIPYGYILNSYIPSYTVEGEEFGGFDDFDEGIAYEEELEKIEEWLKQNNYNIYDGYNIKYEVEDHLDEFNLSLEDFGGSDQFEQIISYLVSDYGLSDDGIYAIITNKAYLDLIIRHYNDGSENKVANNIDELSAYPNIIDVSKTDGVYIGFNFDCIGF